MASRSPHLCCILGAAMALFVAAPCLSGPAPLTIGIHDAVALALRRHEAMGIAAAETATARQRVREVRADGLPDLRAGFDVTRNWLLPIIVFNDTEVKLGSDNELTGQLRLDQPLYTGGRVDGAVRAARHQALASHQEERQVRQALTARVETAVYDYLLAAELARVSRASLQRARASLVQVEALRAAGRVTAFDVLRAGVQVSESAADSIAAVNGLALAAIDVKDAIGLKLDTPLTVKARFRTSTDLDLDDVDGLVRLALKRRPEQRRMTALLEAGSGDLEVARAGSRPRVDLVAVARVNYQDDSFSRLAVGQEWRRSWSTGVALQVPLFDGMRSQARTAQASQDLKRLHLERSRLERAVAGEVRRAWMMVREAEERLRARQGQVEQGRQGLQDAQARYRSGGGTQLEVLDAQVSLRQAESAIAQARRDRAVALVQLERATGTLGEDAE